MVIGLDRLGRLHEANEDSLNGKRGLRRCHGPHPEAERPQAWRRDSTPGGPLAR